MRAGAAFERWPGMLLGLSLVSAIAASWPSLMDLARQWQSNEAYGHGFLIVLIAVYLAVQRLPTLTADTRPSAWYLPLLVLSLSALVTAGYSGLHVLVHYGLFGVICSLVLGVTGWQGMRGLAIPLGLLFLSIPLPGFLEANLTAELKLLSSQWGTSLLQLLRVSAYNEGNIIDLGTLRLHVADACSGLNYLFPLLAIGLMIAGFLQTALWQRIAVVVLTVPLTITMNVIRIVAAGLLGKHVGPDTASGFIHDFQGWMVFLCSLALMVPVVALLVRLGPNRTTVGKALHIDFSLPAIGPIGWLRRPDAKRNLMLAAILIIGALILTSSLAARAKIHPHRTDFSTFPTLVGTWFGNRSSLDGGTLMTLKMSDYLLARYRSPDHGESVELFAAYYVEQTDGTTPHSPNICLPGGGWQVLSLERRMTDVAGGHSLPFNRALMQAGDEQLLVYYWYPQRGRLFANEFLMKWFIFQDSILMNRSDGGFVRLTTPVTESVSAADTRLQAFQRDIWDVLPRHIPGSMRF